jgi:protein FAM32A
MEPAFTGGSLSFKGDKKAKKKKNKTKHQLEGKDTKAAIHVQTDLTDSNAEAFMTEAEKKALKRKLERERKELERIATKSHRERIEELNEKLASQTEHNDIPRVCKTNCTRMLQWIYNVPCLTLFYR